VLLWVAAGSLLLDALGNIGHNQLLALEKMVTTSTIVVTHIALQIVFTAAVLFAGGGLLGLYVATLAAGLLRAVLYWIALRRVGVSPHFPVQTDIVRVLLVGGLPLAISAFLALIYSHVDRLLVFSVLGEKQAGNVVSAFVVIFGVSEIISVTVLTALFPLMSRMAANQTDALRRLTDQLAMLTLLVSLPLAALVSGLAARLAAVLFPGFVSTSQVLELLIWQAVVQMVGNAYAQLMMVEARQIRLMLYRLAGLTVNIALNLLLLPRIGVQAVSISLLATHIVMLILFLIYRRPDSAARASLARQAGGMALAGVLMLGTLLVVRDINPILAALAGSALYVALIVALRVLRPEDWALLRRVVNNLPFVQRGRTV
jgi:O-antigen/teichoic acid export membrane protein